MRQGRSMLIAEAVPYLRVNRGTLARRKRDESPRGNPSQYIADLVGLCRIRHWSKNIFVLMPLVFSGMVLLPWAVGRGALAVACFCLWSSSVYLINDVLDAAADRQHPRKRARAIAAGRVSPVHAVSLGLVLAAVAAGLAIGWLPALFCWLGLLYLVHSLAYTLWIKNIVILDVIAIAVGFNIRLWAGCAAIAVEPTSWLMVCGFSLALFLGFGKRRLETILPESATEYRPTLRYYTAEKVDLLLGITCSVTLLSYMLYTTSPDTTALHGTTRLIYTVPIVAYGLFRYLFKVQDKKADGPVDIVTGDWVFGLVAIAWLLTAGVIVLTA
jgi:decaprenyl-phosphate phosphoribosyltransferase